MPKKSTDLHGLPVVKVSRRGANRLKDGHVWVYRSDIVSADGIAPGAWSRWRMSVAKCWARALQQRFANCHSDDFKEAVKDLNGLLRKRMQAAIAYRERMVRAPTLTVWSSAKAISCLA